MNEHPTIAIQNGEVSLLQGLEAQSEPCLILYSGPDVGRRFDLKPGRVVVGRSPGAGVMIDSVGISRRHFELEVGSASVELHDLGSANRTYVNDEPVGQPVRLRDGDLVRIANVVLRFHERRSLDALLHDRIYRMATVDIGTGLYNRRYVQEALKIEFARSRREQTPLALLCCDLDHFKVVNDRYGHQAGDAVLRTCAVRLRDTLRDSDIVGRWGGEEFVVVLRDTTMENASMLAERLRVAVAREVHEIEVAGPNGPQTVQHHQTMSVGVAIYKPAMADEFDLMAAADRMLYAAKRNGRDRVQASD